MKDIKAYEQELLEIVKNVPFDFKTNLSLAQRFTKMLDSCEKHSMQKVGTLHPGRNYWLQGNFSDDYYFIHITSINTEMVYKYDLLIRCSTESVKDCRNDPITKYGSKLQSHHLIFSIGLRQTNEYKTLMEDLVFNK